MSIANVALAVVLAGAASAALAQSRVDEFEVVSIRPANPEAVASGTTIRGTSWEAKNLSLKRLVEYAYPDFADVGLVVGGPSWFRSSRFDIQAKAAQLITDTSARRMLRQALSQHFGLQVRMETSPLDVYAVVYARDDRRLGPNIRRSTAECIAARDNRLTLPAKCVPVRPEYVQGFSRPMSTMADLVNTLRWHVSGYLDGPIVDRTDLKGIYDISVWYSRPDLTASSSPLEGRSAVLTEVQSLISALPSQLGFRLERRRDSVEVLVIQSASMPVLD